LITDLTHTTIWVLDQDEALAFYTEKLGFEVNTDATMDDFRSAGLSTSSSSPFPVRR
jgi:catechol 2,3-dioxygenase-like lactoylglutathione lyase family enzyme